MRRKPTFPPSVTTALGSLEIFRAPPGLTEDVERRLLAELRGGASIKEALASTNVPAKTLLALVTTASKRCSAFRVAASSTSAGAYSGCNASDRSAASAARAAKARSPLVRAFLR